MKNPKVGFIGVGAMGGPMARQLAAAGFNLKVFDSDSAVMKELQSIDGLNCAKSVSDTVIETDILFSCLPNDEVVRTIYLGENGIGNVGQHGLITIDCSTVSPRITREVHAAFEQKGIKHLDASMLGSVLQAETGNIGFIVGGEREAFEIISPLLSVMGKMVRHVGESGTANQMKLIHQTLVAGHAVAVAEAMALCLMTDTDIETFYDIVCEGGGLAHSRYFENRVPRLRAGEFSPLFMLRFMLKDARLAAELIDNAEEKLPVLSQVVKTLELGFEAGWGNEDFSAVIHVHEQHAGKSIAKSREK